MVLQGQDLSDFKWKNRLLILTEISGATELGTRQKTLFLNREKEMAERDLLLFYYDGKVVYDEDGKSFVVPMGIMPYLQVPGLLLIGKDGGVKLRADFITDPEEVFTLIDRMPMRRSELRNRPED